MLFKKHNIWL